MIIETLQRGINDLGWIVDNKEKGLVVCFKDCEFQVNSYWDNNLFSKGFEGDHIMSVRLPKGHEHFTNLKLSPVLWRRFEQTDYEQAKENRAKKQRIH